MKLYFRLYYAASMSFTLTTHLTLAMHLTLTMHCVSSKQSVLVMVAGRARPVKCGPRPKEMMGRWGDIFQKKPDKGLRHSRGVPNISAGHGWWEVDAGGA